MIKPLLLLQGVTPSKRGGLAFMIATTSSNGVDANKLYTCNFAGRQLFQNTRLGFSFVLPMHNNAVRLVLYRVDVVNCYS